MTTTAIFAEILVIGLQGLAWIALGLQWGDVVDFTAWPWEKLAKWSALITIVVVALAYSTGVLIDRLADSLITPGLRIVGLVPQRASPTDSERKGESGRHAQEPASIIRMRVLFKGEGMVDFLEYQRSRIRLARATAFNTLPLTAFGAALAPTGSAGIAISLAGLIAFATAVFAVSRISEARDARMAQAMRLIDEQENARTDPPPSK